MSKQLIDPAIMAFVDGGLRLTGGRCGDCGETAFPARESCGRCCGTDITRVTLADQGALWSWTVQRFPPPSPPYVPAVGGFEPFGLGYVELPGEVIVEARLTEADPAHLRIGMPMRLVAFDVLDGDGTTATTFAFAPAGSDLDRSGVER